MTDYTTTSRAAWLFFAASVALGLLVRYLAYGPTNGALTIAMFGCLMSLGVSMWLWSAR